MNIEGSVSELSDKEVTIINAVDPSERIKDKTISVAMSDVR